MAGGVLIVADECGDQRQLERVIRGAGYTVSDTLTGLEALDGRIEATPGLVVVDVTADEMNGFKVCRELAKNADIDGAPIIVISDEYQNVDRLWAEQQGASGLLTKPYSVEELVEQLRRFS